MQRVRRVPNSCESNVNYTAPYFRATIKTPHDPEKPLPHDPEKPPVPKEPEQPIDPTAPPPTKPLEPPVPVQEPVPTDPKVPDWKARF